MSDSSNDSQTSGFVRNNIVKIVNKDGEFYGTGFCLDFNQKKYFVTCHHCICNLDQIFIENDNRKYLCKWEKEYSDWNMDLAVLTLENNDECVKPLQNNLQMLPKLDVFVWGFSSTDLEQFPQGSPVENGKLSEESFLFHWNEQKINGINEWNKKPAVNVNVFNFNGSYDLGFSGAPVCYDGNKKVIGIFTAKDNNYGYVIPIETLLKKFNKNSKIITAQSTVNTKEYLEKGNLFYEKRKLKDAIDQYNKIITADVNYLNALSNKGKCLIELGKNSEAIELFKLVLDINPNFVYALNGMSDALNYLGRYEEAIEWCEKALKIDPNNVDTFTSKADALNYLGKYEEAIEWCEKALKIDPNNSIFLSLKGLALGELKRHEAIEWCDKALKIDPENVLVLNNKGLALDRLGRYEEAIEWFDKALKIDPDYVFSIGNKGYALNNLGRYEEAIEWFDKVLKIDPKYFNALNSKGSTLSNLGKYKEAIEWFDKALEINPSYTVAHENKKSALNRLSNQKIN